MMEENNIQLFREKIAQLHQAIFYIYNESGDRMPVNLIEINKVDDNGNIWFNIARLPLFTDLTFYVGELVFYKKGIPYYTICYGAGTIEAFEPLLLKFEVSFTETSHYEESIGITEYIKKLPVIRYLTSFHYSPRDLKLG
jgi:hypothetical protein